MKPILTLSLSALLFLLACQRGYDRNSRMEIEDEVLADTVAYAMLLDGFEKQFATIEAEYDSASTDRQLELEADFEEADQAMVEAQKQFIRDYPASFQSLLVLNEIDWSFESASELREFLDLLDPSLHENSQFRKLDHLAGRMALAEVGKQAPDFTLEDADGTARKLSEHYQSSEYLLLDFWASNCGPCRKENRNIVRAYERFHDRGFDVLGVSTDTRREDWISAIASDGLVWTNVCSLEPWSDSEVVELYALRQTSQNFLLDRSGKIIAKDLRGEELTATLEELFNR